MNAPDLFLKANDLMSVSLEEQAIACVLLESRRVSAAPLIRGLSNAAFEAMNQALFGEVIMDNGTSASAPFDEFDELHALLMEYLVPHDDLGLWLVCAMATAAQRENHLWQDMGLPSRRQLSELMTKRFPALAARNTQDMKWKKFFYRQLCQRAEILICKSPNCAQCSDHALCFGAEV